MIAALHRHPNAKAVLSTTTPSHAYIFHGPGGSGKRQAARELAAAWLAEGAPEPAGAHARALAGNHPDLTWVTPSGAHEVLVSDIDMPVIAAASKTPFESLRRVFVIEGADMLGDQAANRLLKTLEEPPSYVHIVLITDQLAQVLPTIRSRCQSVRFEPQPEAELAAALTAQGVQANMAAALARLGMGDADSARALATPEGVKLRTEAITLVRATLAGELGAAPWSGLLAAAKGRGEAAKADLDLAGKAELALYPRKEQARVEKEWTERSRRGQRRAQTAAIDQALTLIESWLLDLAALSWRAPELVRNSDRQDELIADLERSGADQFALREAVELVEDTRQRLQLNVSEDLALEALSYRLEATLTR